MSWLINLVDMYDYLDSQSKTNPESEIDLTPPATIWQNAQLEIVLSSEGELLRGTFR